MRHCVPPFGGDAPRCRSHHAVPDKRIDVPDPYGIKQDGTAFVAVFNKFEPTLSGTVVYTNFCFCA